MPMKGQKLTAEQKAEIGRLTKASLARKKAEREAALNQPRKGKPVILTEAQREQRSQAIKAGLKRRAEQDANAKVIQSVYPALTTTQKAEHSAKVKAGLAKKRASMTASERARRLLAQLEIAEQAVLRLKGEMFSLLKEELYGP